MTNPQHRFHTKNLKIFKLVDISNYLTKGEMVPVKGQYHKIDWGLFYMK